MADTPFDPNAAPAFDPTKPFDPADAPAFDPSKSTSSSAKPNALEKAIEPITSYPATYSQMNKDARQQIGQGIEQLSSPQGAMDVAKGVGNVAMGGLGYVTSPISAGLRTIVGKPIEENTGIPKEYSEFAASLAIPGIGFTKAASAPAAAVPTASEIRAAATAAYKSPEVAALKLHPDIMPAAANVIRIGLEQQGFDPLLAPKTFGLVDKAVQSVPEGAQFVTAQNFQTLRRMLGKAAESPDKTERAAAQIAQRNIDDIMGRIPPGAVLEGDPQAAAAILRDARGNYAAASRTDRFQEALTKADRQTESAGIGGNWENATRQRIRDILNSPAKSRGLSDTEKSALEDYVGGTFTRNSLRVATKVLGGDNPLMAAIHVGISPLTSGGTLAAPLTGFALKKINNAISAKELERVDELLRSRSPLAESMRNSISSWAKADAQYAMDPTSEKATKFFLATRALGDRFKNGGIDSDLRQLFGPLQGSSPVRADQQQQ